MNAAIRDVVPAMREFNVSNESLGNRPEAVCYEAFLHAARCVSPGSQTGL